MKNIQFRVINRETRDELILNYKELNTFLKNKNYRDFAITPIESRKETWLGIIAFGCLVVASVLLLTKILMQWI
tara:strand:- start:11111 stop:11332 length:222 start_codon:yes stop_codon:yes gene_type:complete